MKIEYSLMNNSNMPLWVAREAGYWGLVETYDYIISVDTDSIRLEQISAIIPIDRDLFRGVMTRYERILPGEKKDYVLPVSFPLRDSNPLLEVFEINKDKRDNNDSFVLPINKLKKLTLEVEYYDQDLMLNMKDAFEVKSGKRIFSESDCCYTGGAVKRPESDDEVFVHSHWAIGNRGKRVITTINVEDYRKNN